MKIPSVKNFRMNAVLFKDLQQKTKRSQLVVSVFLLNLFLSLIAAIILISIAVEASQFTPIDYSIFSTFFIVLAFMEFGFILIIVPAVTSGAITIEREKQTFDVLLTTALTTRQIIFGKYWASITQVMLLIFSGFPIFALVFMYGGVTFFQAIGVLVTLLLVTMYVSSVGIFFSSRMKKTIVATVLTYVILLVLMFGTISFIATSMGLTAAINELIREQTGQYSDLNCDFVVFILYLNPLCTIFDSLCGLFGVDILFGEPGMSGLLAAVTNYSRSNILLAFWTPISIVLQMLASWWLLEVSAKAIDPLRKKADKYAKKRKRQKQTA